jgi:hypothetical protein
MNKKLFVPLPACLLLLQSAPLVTAQDQCDPMPVPDQCQNAPGVTINTYTRGIAPPNICVEAGKEIRVNVVPRGEVRIAGKTGGWPQGSGGSFTVVAPEAGEYDYNVYFGDGSCIDPRMTVR